MNLTATGKLDWVHWGLYTETSLNRKAGVTQQISDFTLVGPNADFLLAAYQYSDNANSYTWYDGWPSASVTNTMTGVWAYDAEFGVPDLLGYGFRITAPADTSQRILQVFVGAFAAEGKFTASLSDGSAPTFNSQPNATVNNAGNGPGGVFTIDYSANSPGQTLTVTWTLAKTNGADANVTLQAATLTAPGADNPPFAFVTNPANDAAFAAPTNLTLIATAQDFDGSVTNVAFYADATKLGQTTNSPATNHWNSTPIGHYMLTAAATDNAGLSRSSPPVEIFVYGSGGRLAGAVANPPATVDLTGEGTNDWVHWGLSNASSFDYKTNVFRQISNFTPLGSSAVQQFADNYSAFSWSDGTPTPGASGTTTGVFIPGVTNGFEFTALADTNARTLRVYVGCFGAQGQFEAWLSDFSAPPFIDTSVMSEFGNSYAVYTLNYAAASPGQQLVVLYRSLTLFDQVYGNVTLQAATLQGGPRLPPSFYLANPKMIGNYFTFSFVAQSNYNYTVQYADTMPPTNWWTFTNLTGAGASVSVTNLNVGSSQRYYRVQTQ